MITIGELVYKMGAFGDFKAPVFKNLTSAIRALAMDAVQKANSGHPGMPMGMAEIAEVLWIHHMRHNPSNPKWADRDRFERGIFNTTQVFI